MSIDTKCRPKKCDRKETCYRYKARASEMQAYFIDRVDKKCKYYWDINNKEEFNDPNLVNMED